MSDSLLTAQRYVISLAVVLTAVLFAPALADPVNVIKLTVLVLAALALVTVAFARVVRHREVQLPRGPVVWVAGALGLAFVISAVAAPTGATAVVGTYGRNSGLLAYAAALVLFFTGLRVWSASTAHILAAGLLVSGLYTASYGLLQYVGVDAIHWNNPFNPIIAAMGNPDFASGYLGLCTPVAAYGALSARWPRWVRVTSAVIGVTCLLAALLSSAVQGPLAAAAGLAVVALAWLLERGGSTARRGLLGLAGIAAVGGLTLLAGIAKIGPAASFFSGISYQARTWYWDAAISMFQMRPLVGVGLDHYGAYWRQVRPAESTEKIGPDNFSDSAHSVPLQMLAQGGILLALAYLAFTVVIAILLVQGLRALSGDARLLIGGLGGVWVAYVVQSTVSIDQVPLLTVQFATAGAVAALAARGHRTLRLPGALRPVEPPVRGGKRRTGPAIARSRSMTGVDYALVSGAGVVALVAAWFALAPMRANAATHSGDLALRAGDGTAALQHYHRATDLVSGIGTYWERTVTLLTTVKQDKMALDAARRGSRHDPFNVGLLRTAAQLSDQAGQKDDARAYARRALRLDPSNPEVQALARDVGAAGS